MATQTPAVQLPAAQSSVRQVNPAGIAVCMNGRRISYRELQDHVDRLAGGLADLGVDRGDRVALVLPNCPQHVIGFFAIPMGKTLWMPW